MPRPSFASDGSTLHDRLTAPALRVRAVDPNSGNDFELGTCKALYVGTGGSVELVAEQDSSPVIFTNVPDGSFIPVRTKQVLAAGTTASDILALYD